MTMTRSPWDTGKVRAFALRLLLLVVAAALLAACSHDVATPGQGPAGEEPGRVSYPFAAKATLVSLAVTPPTASVPALVAQQFKATGTYSDGTTKALTPDVNWNVSNPSVATVDTGLVTPLQQGAVTVTATDPTTGISGTASLTVTAATLVSIAVTPGSKQIPIGPSQNFTATGTFSDGTKFPLDPSSVSWTTTNAAIATVGSAGGATGVSEGTVAVVATNPATGLSAQAVLIVGTETLVSVEITPSTPSIPKGQTQSFVATGFYSDGTTFDLTDLATWSSSSGGVAKISNVAGSIGLATAAGVGTTTITAKIAGVSGTATLTVTAALLQSIAVTPATTSLPNGTTQQLTATGTYSDGTTKNITKTVTWTSALPSMVSVSNASGSIGLATALSLGAATVIATDPTTQIGSSATLTVTAAVLKSLAITPASASLPIGLQKSFTATGTFTDLTTQNMTATVLWTSSAPAIGTISNAAGSAGVATAVSVGTTSITALDPVSGISAKAATLKATAAVLSSITINPPTATIPVGFGVQYAATGIYSDGSSQNLTSTVTWKVTAGSATISNAAGSQGLASTTKIGLNTIQASSGSIKAAATLTVTSATLSSISVTPAMPSIALGTTQQFAATGIFSDSTTLNLTSLVTWSSGTYASISNAAGTYGLATALVVGKTGIAAQYRSVSGSTTLTITPARLVSIAITPPSPSLPSGLTEQFVATGTFTDHSTQDLLGVTWSTGSPGVMTVSNASGSYGLGTALSPGTTFVTATDPTTGIAGATSVTVTSAILVSVAITPSTANLPLGTFLQLTATGTYSDKSTQVLTNSATWASSSGSISVANAPTIPAGLATSVSLGASVVTATDPVSGISGTATLTATAAALVSIAVSPATQSVASGLTQQYIAIGTYTDGSTMNLTQSATWSSSSASALISNAAGSQGLATAGPIGTATITATDPATLIQGSATLTATVAMLVSISVTPPSPNIPVGLTSQLTATGTYTDGSTLNITSAVTWTSSAASIASVSNATPGAGLTSGISVGSATVMATDPATGIAATASVTVVAPVAVSMIITPSSVTLLTGQTQQLSATATLSDGSTANYTGSVTWVSNAASVYVSSVASDYGLAIGVSIGSGTVTATDPSTGVAAGVAVTVSLNTNDDAAQEFTPYVNPVGNWSFGWENAPGAGFNAYPDSYNGGGTAVDEWYGFDASGNTTAALHNATPSSVFMVENAPLGPGQLAMLPPYLATDMSHADTRWTAPIAGVYQVTANFTGTTATLNSSVFAGYACRGLDGSSDAACGYQEVNSAYPGGEAFTGNYNCGQAFLSCDTCYFDYYCPFAGESYCVVTMNSPGGCYQYPSLTGYFPIYETVTTQIQSTTDVAILQDGASIFAGFINLNGAGNAQTYTANLNLNAGDTLDFEIGNGGTASYYDLTLFDAQIISCPAGQTACNGTCADTSSDPNNCGGCGLTCPTGCNAGQCVVTLASGQNNPYAIAVDSTSVYWTDYNSGNVMSVPINGGAAVTLASGQSEPQTIAVDSTSVYWGNGGGGVFSVPLAGGAVTTLAAGFRVGSVAVDANNVYWVTPGFVASMPLVGGTITTLASAVNYLSGMAVDATSVYWTDYGAGIISSVPIGGGTVATLATDQVDPWHMAVDSTSVYWTNRNYQAGPGSIVKVPIAGGVPTTLASGQDPGGIAVDGTNVYFNEGGGTVGSVPLAGGSVTTLASDGSEVLIAVDATSVYWPSGSGSIMKLTPK